MQRHVGSPLMVTAERASITDGPSIRSALGDEAWAVDRLVQEVSEQSVEFRPFDDLIMSFSEALSSELMKIREHPEVVALGFWMRPGSVANMRASIERGLGPNQLLVPRGLAFHVTPANVDTLSVYSWMLSLLMGNSNIVRLSARTSAARQRILAAIATVLAHPQFDPVAKRQRFILSDHDDLVSQTLSAAADVRVLWGGDATVDYFRRFPIPVRSRDIVFPDRHSFAILDERSVAGLDENELAGLADRFFNDVYWFDQGACASPRLVVWRTTSDADAETTRARFHDAVAGAIRRRGYQAETGMALNKISFALNSAARSDGAIIETPSNEATWVLLPNLDTYDRENCGGGLFFEVLSSDLSIDLAGLVSSRDQTAVCFGLDSDTVRALAAGLNGLGIDRFVPVGQALQFGSVWDGLELLQEFSKRVVVDVSA